MHAREYILRWVAEGMPAGIPAAVAAEHAASLNDAPAVELPVAVRAAIAADEEEAPGELGHIRWSYVAAYEAAGLPIPGEVGRFIGRAILNPCDRRLYDAAVTRIRGRL